MTRQSRRLLILGGTSEARELAELAGHRWGERLTIITSLAGRTEAPLRIAGTLRRGGFGGAASLATFLRVQTIDYLIDATHPFATRISRNAAAAATAVGLPHLAIVRPSWRPGAGDHWIDVADAAEAAAAIPALGRRVWLTVGSADADAFASVPQTWFLVRRVDPPSAPLPLPDHTLILGRGPFALADERRLIAEYRIQALVCRDSGGRGAQAKLVAAADAGLPVVMIRRPDAPPMPAVATASEALAWLSRCLDA